MEVFTEGGSGRLGNGQGAPGQPVSERPRCLPGPSVPGEERERKLSPAHFHTGGPSPLQGATRPLHQEPEGQGGPPLLLPARGGFRKQASESKGFGLCPRGRWKREPVPGRYRPRAGFAWSRSESIHRSCPDPGWSVRALWQPPRLLGRAIPAPFLRAGRRLSPHFTGEAAVL